MTGGWINDDRNVIFGETFPLTYQYASFTFSVCCNIFDCFELNGSMNESFWDIAEIKHTFPPEWRFCVIFFFCFLQISIPWVGSQIKEVKTLRDSIAISKSLAQGKWRWTLLKYWSSNKPFCILDIKDQNEDVQLHVYIWHDLRQLL